MWSQLANNKQNKYVKTINGVTIIVYSTIYYLLYVITPDALGRP